MSFLVFTASKDAGPPQHTPAFKEAVGKCIEQVLHPLYKQGELSKYVGVDTWTERHC